MKKIFLVFSFLFVSQAFADGVITTTIDSLTNVGNSSALEACGTSVHKDGIRPLLVTIQHDESFYTTLTAPNDKWCVVIKRWTNSGRVSATAVTLM